ncbi:autotransporter outer membrane beta-barrel domain-containing protein [Ruegeria sp. A3M17]|uniref:autotransporter family protein n=1 Tax=Ruegeria sp. A3M17 TaxID=2267229 RepID=UPI001314DC96|nr:autotransporter outer membrane beta-barrel domain-containing protein [Ruegeria sp. A3M17]
MKRRIKAALLCSSAVTGLFLASTVPATAQSYCSVASEPGLSLGCARTLVDASLLLGLNPANRLINPIIGSHDGLVFDSDWIANSARGGHLRFGGNVSFTRGLNSSWANTYFGSARTDGGRTALEITAYDIPTENTVPSNTVVELQFDRLTLENTAVTLRDGASDDGAHTGQISYLLIGDGAVGRGGVLALRNASLTFEDSTDLFMAAPDGGTPVIRAETGDNLLQLGNQSTNLNRLSVVVDDGANLTFDGTAITPRTEGNLTVGSGANLVIENNSVLGLLSNVGSSLPQSTVNGGTVTVDGLSSELRLTAPVFNNSTVSLEDGGTLRIEQRNGVRSTLSFSGDNTLNFGSPEAAVLGADANPQALILEVGAGTTTITNTGGVNNLGRGLQVDQVRIDGGTLDTTGYSVRDDVTDAWQYLSVENGGTFYDRAAFYRNIDRLIVDGGTLLTNSSFGDFFGAADGIETARFTNSTIDLVSSSSAGSASGNVSVGLRSVVLNAENLAFAGTNQVRVGISPAGECVAGICTPGTTIYAGELVANVGGSSTSTLTGFDTVLFVPFAIDANAVAADYIAGGNNGIYTVARADYNPDLTSNVQGFDAAPMTATATQLSAARSDLPANLVYTIVNNPVADDRVDISFVDIGLLNHPLIATGTGNTMSYGSLVVNSNNTLTHADLLQVQTLHPEAYASYMTVALEHSDQRRNMVLLNARGMGVADGKAEGFTDDGRRFWIDTAISAGNVDSDGNLAGFDYNLGELILGADLWSSPEGRIGAYVGYGTYSMDEHTSAIASDLSSTAFHLGAYGAYDVDDWSLTGMAGMSWAQTDGTRTAITGSGANTHNANYSSRTIEAAVRAEYNGWQPLGAFSFAPEFGLGYAHYSQDGFTETGASSSALNIYDTSAESLVASIGLNFSGPEFGGGLIPIGFARYEHDFLASSQRTHSIDASFASTPGVSQSFVGTHRGPDSLSVGLGLRAAPGSAWDVSAGLVYTVNTYGEEFGGGIRVSWNF